jgi:hypothetical protein
MRVREIDGDVGGQGEGGVLSHLDALVPGDRFEQVRWHAADRADDCLADRAGVPAAGSGTGTR